jgi:gamma-glutamyl:cysteine ligase YbdK (ATP-grasp superfamily)
MRREIRREVFHMGLLIDRDTFSDADHAGFSARLAESLEALRQVLQRPEFGTGPASIGAELELFLVDTHGLPLPLNRAVLAQTVDPRVTVELDRFNLECNTRPGPLAGRPFSMLSRELSDALAEVNRAAALHGARVATIGILPTLRQSDLGPSAMTDLPRYRALDAGIRRIRGAPFHLRIDGDDPLILDMGDVTSEGACTSLQIHLRVDPAAFARIHNAAQIATAPVLAVAGNSPLLFGHRLWEETRIALFKQSVDDRHDLQAPWRPSARVSFGHGWVREGAHELFAESVRLHAPLLPVLGTEDALSCCRAGGTPLLEELRLHHGTVWRWNRAVYDPTGGGHVRIEFRALPAGPSIIDMVANSAFLLGLTLGLAPEMDRLLPALPFEHAHSNFYRAAQDGLRASLLWPSDQAPSPRPIRAADLVPRLLPVARQGLLAAGVDPVEVDTLLAIIAERAASGMTGARWQRAVLAAMEQHMPRDAALAAMLERYLAHASTGLPVHCWPTAQ